MLHIPKGDRLFKWAAIIAFSVSTSCFKQKIFDFVLQIGQLLESLFLCDSAGFSRPGTLPLSSMSCSYFQGPWQSFHMDIVVWVISSSLFHSLIVFTADGRKVSKYVFVVILGL